MFTGIITDVGRVERIEKRGDTRFVIATRYDTATIDIGASIACSGPCLTVVDKGPGWFAVDVSAETLACTNLGAWQVGTAINLERALKVGDELGGHIVSGHVDGVAKVVSVSAEGDSQRWTFEAPAALAKYIAPKGSIALEGASLTVNEVDGARFGVNLIPHTQAKTTFGAQFPNGTRMIDVGSPINVEIDVLARYVARLASGD
jgi:riboflavin synthase